VNHINTKNESLSRWMAFNMSLICPFDNY